SMSGELATLIPMCPPALSPRQLSGTDSGIPGVSAPGSSYSFQIILSAAYPSDISFTLRMSVNPDVVASAPGDDFAFIQPGGGKTINCSVPANSTSVSCGGSSSVGVQI